MDEYETKLDSWLVANEVAAEQLFFKKSCHSVAAAAEAANADPDHFIKSICLKLDTGTLIVAIVKGEDRVSTKRVAKVMGSSEARLATPNEILEETGFPVGGTPPFGFKATFLIDPRVMEKDVVFAGGGSTKSLLHLKTKALQQANNGRTVRIRK
jgi:Cys-tRNA(Pro)/Cys-tRNA(Cys) deacylase